MRIDDILKLPNILFEYKTKEGKDIIFKRIEDAEEDKNRGWQVDQIDAYVDGERVGYIKMSYIPHLRMEKHYLTIYNWMHKMKGTYLLPPDKRSYHYKDLSNEERRKMLEHVAYMRYVPWGEERGFVESLNDKEVLEKLREFEERLNNDSQGTRFRQFKNYHKDKPIVDFIRVEDKFQRQRIGEALYLEGAKWMREKGMKLHASGLQTDEAKKVWDHLGKNYKVKSAKRKNRKYLEV